MENDKIIQYALYRYLEYENSTITTFVLKDEKGNSKIEYTFDFSLVKAATKQALYFTILTEDSKMDLDPDSFDKNCKHLTEIMNKKDGDLISRYNDYRFVILVHNTTFNFDYVKNHLSYVHLATKAGFPLLLGLIDNAKEMIFFRDEFIGDISNPSGGFIP